MIKLLTVEVTGDNQEHITFHVILGINVSSTNYFRNSVHITPAQNIHNIGGVKQRVH